jgi:hypothetical protein
MADPNFLPGQTLEAGRLRSIAPWTLLFSGVKDIPSGAGTTTVVNTLANVVDTDEIAWSISNGAITLPEGGLFLVSLVGSFATTTGGNIRRAHVHGSTFGDQRLAPFNFPTAGSAGTGLQVCGAVPIDIEPGETIDVRGRQDSGATMSATFWLGLTRLAVST